MQAVHKTLLEVNEEFLVAEAPAAPLLTALQEKHVLTDLDLQQLRSLEAQGSRAVKRFLLHVLPLRGPVAFPALLEALQEAHAQHLVDLLLEEEAVLLDAVKPIELPERKEVKPREDPNEYARKLRANMDLIESAVEPEHLTPSLLQNGVLTTLEEHLLEEVKGRHVLTWSVLWGVLMQRGAKAYSAFMGALLQHGYSALFHTIEETKTTGPDALESALLRHTAAEPNNSKYFTVDYNSNVTSLAPHHLSKPDSAQSTDFIRSMVSPLPNGPLATSSPAPQTSSLKPTVSRRSSEVANVIPHRGEEPLEHRNSLGDVEFQGTSESEQQVSDQDSDDMPQTVDLLYNPSWADAYNHLRDVNEEDPLYVHRSFTDGISDRKSPNPFDPGYPSKHASVDLNLGNNENDNTDATNTALEDEEKPTELNDIPVSGPMEAIPEQDSESEPGTHVDGKHQSAGQSSGSATFRIER